MKNLPEGNQFGCLGVSCDVRKVDGSLRFYTAIDYDLMHVITTRRKVRYGAPVLTSQSNHSCHDAMRRIAISQQEKSRVASV
ncbi:hypothetical protein [Flaviaesturariibacter amylovorans]|uniref:hypothetical protein n=1 Tax=Flaviaesturariibacter amylovorans TaxID=1084520 RepID=UPI0031E89AA3